MVSVSLARLLTIVLAVVLLVFALASLGSLVQDVDGDSIYSLVVCIFTIIALLIGVYAGITLKRPFLFVYMCMAAVILCLWVVSAVWAIFDSDGVDWYTFTLGVINTLCWLLATFFAYFLWKIAHNFAY